MLELYLFNNESNSEFLSNNEYLISIIEFIGNPNKFNLSTK